MLRRKELQMYVVVVDTESDSSFDTNRAKLVTTVLFIMLYYCSAEYDFRTSTSCVISEGDDEQYFDDYLHSYAHTYMQVDNKKHTVSLKFNTYLSMNLIKER